MKAKLVIGLFAFYFVFGAILGCSNVRIVYPAERYNEIMANLPDNCRAIPYEKHELRTCYIEINPDGNHVMHVIKGDAKCLEHELWHCENPNKSHDDMPDYLKHHWKSPSI